MPIELYTKLFNITRQQYTKYPCSGSTTHGKAQSMEFSSNQMELLAANLVLGMALPVDRDMIRQPIFLVM